MRRRHVIGIIVCGTVVTLLGGCQVGFKRLFRFRMTVEVVTPQGTRTGSSVYEITAAPYYDPTLDKAPYDTDLIGQAVTIDLLDGPVFALTTGTRSIQQVTVNALNDSKDPAMNDYVATIGRLGSEHVKADLPRHDWPLVVRFRDLNDPKSVEAVNPDTIGVKRMWLETTHDPVTTGIEKRLRWITNAVDFWRAEPVYGRWEPPEKQTIVTSLSRMDFISQFGR